MKIKSVVSFLILFLLFLVSCDYQSGVTQTSTYTVKPTLISSPIPTISSTLTPSKTLPPEEATLQADFATYRATHEHRMFTAVPATLEARGVECQTGYVIEQYLDIIGSSNDEWTLYTCTPVSSNPDEKWTPGVVDYGTRYTQLIKTDLSKTWTIQHDTFDYSIIDRPDALMVPFRWTADGKYLYLYPRIYPGPSGFPQSAFLYTHINNLYRINLETGDFELILERNQFGALAFSPNDQLLVYSERSKPDVIHIRNMESGSDQQIKLNEEIVAAGVFTWDSESTKVIFTVGYAKQSDNWQDDLSGTAIFVLNPQNMHVQEIFAKDSRIFRPYECSGYSVWLDKHTICLYSMNYEGESVNKIFTLNINTGEVAFLRQYP